MPHCALKAPTCAREGSMGGMPIDEKTRDKLEGRYVRIATQLERIWPIPAQETLTYAPPIVDGNRLYFRGERYLYCIGER